MAETAGLVIGAVSVASLFTDCVDCFNYIRVGQTLEDNFPLYQTELNVLQLCFSRWAQAVTELSTASSPAITDDLAPLVEKNLKYLARLFQRAREDAEDYTDVPNTSHTHLEPHQVPRLTRLHLKLKNVIDHRQKTTKTVGFGKRTQWALYKKEEFVTLIVNVRTKVDDLEGLISVAKLREKLMQMQVEDAKEVHSDNKEEMKLVEESVKDVNPSFSQTVERIRSGHSFSETEISDYSAVQMGDSVATGYTGPLSKAYNTYAKTKISKHTQVSMGTLHGTTVFDRF